MVGGRRVMRVRFGDRIFFGAADVRRPLSHFPTPAPVWRRTTLITTFQGLALRWPPKFPPTCALMRRLEINFRIKITFRGQGLRFARG